MVGNNPASNRLAIFPIMWMDARFLADGASLSKDTDFNQIAASDDWLITQQSNSGTMMFYEVYDCLIALQCPQYGASYVIDYRTTIHITHYSSHKNLLLFSHLSAYLASKYSFIDKYSVLGLLSFISYMHSYRQTFFGNRPEGLFLSVYLFFSSSLLPSRDPLIVQFNSLS